MLAAESKRPRPDSDRERLDGVGEDRALGRDARELSRIQRVRESRRAAAQQLRADAGGAQPATDSARWATKTPRDHTVPSAVGGVVQRFADHLRSVAATRHAPRRHKYVRRAAAPTTRPPRLHRPHASQHSHLARARETPPREPPRAARAGQRASRQLGLQLLLADRHHQHRRSPPHAYTEPSQITAPLGRGGPCCIPTTPTPTPSFSDDRATTAVNGAKVPFHAHLERRLTTRSKCHRHYLQWWTAQRKAAGAPSEPPK